MAKKEVTKKAVKAVKEPKVVAEKATEVEKTEVAAPKKKVAAKAVKKAGPKKKIAQAEALEAATPGTVMVPETGAEVETAEGATVEVTAEAAKPVKAIKARSAKYQAVRAKIDKSKTHTPLAAVELVKKLSYSKFAGSLEVHIQVKEVGTSVNVTLPHSTGKTVRVAVASDEVLAAVEAGKVDFDVLVSSPQFMPKLAKLARILGPKGLMPNPKNGTLTDNPERKAKEMAGGAQTLKTEKKAPLMHITLGKLSMEAKDLTENLEAVLKALRGRIEKINLAATMSPSVKVLVEQVAV
jgi:large subunit ribosomal protein L1